MSKKQDEKGNELMVPKAGLDADALDRCREESRDARTFVNVAKDKKAFEISSQDEPVSELRGLITGVHPNWTRYTEGADRPEKMFSKVEPKGAGWKRRCDLVMLTAEYGEVVINLSPSAFKHGLGKYLRHLDTFGLQLNQVLTLARVVSAKSKKFGLFNTVQFSPLQVKGGVSANFLPLVDSQAPAAARTEESPIIVDEELEEIPPPGDGDFIPY